jgi:hypothetical protein
LIETLLEALFTAAAEVFKAAWRHDFPDPPHGFERAGGDEVAPRLSPSHPLWDHEIDGHVSLIWGVRRQLMDLREYSRVRIRQLLRSPDTYDGWGWNCRPPRVGDIGIVVHIDQPPGSPEGHRYTVECAKCVEPGAAPLWLGDFSDEELETVPV